MHPPSRHAFLFLLLCSTACFLSIACDDQESTSGDVAPNDTSALDGGADTAQEDTRQPDANSDTGTSDAGSDSAVEDTNLTDLSDTLTPPPVGDPDLNGDGTLNILVLGTSRSISSSAEAFAPDTIASELQSILSADPEITLSINVVAEDIYTRKPVTLGLGQGGNEYTWDHDRHSLLQYYHWPEGHAARLDNLAGRGPTDWDHVVIAADPHIVATLPGYYALGVNTLADKVHEGNAQPLLLMVWPQEDASIELFAQQAYAISDQARVPLPIVAAGRAWEALTTEQKDTHSLHPTPNGAYLAAASIYAHLYDRSAASSDYTYDDGLADAAREAQLAEATRVYTPVPRASASPFSACDIPDRVLSYNQTGSSSEGGILGGLRWVLAKAHVALVTDETPTLNFNYGRANTNFEANKRYQIDPARFDFSLGFPMQDHGALGDTSMLYGLDQRQSESENGTDLGVALYMVREGELPYARAIPIRTLYARLKEAIPTQSAYRDAWHMHRNLDKAAGAFMYTLLTGHCALDDEPADPETDAWRQWMAHKVGYETAWSLMHLSGIAPGFRVLPEAEASTSITLAQPAQLSVSFANPPTHPVTVKLTTNNASAVAVSPTELIFTPENHSTPQSVTLTAVAEPTSQEAFVFSATTLSDDPGYHGLVDRWEYTVQP